jgi:hypothetical protein
MLAPRFSIRTLLAIVTGGAVVFLVAGMAVRGEIWAWGVTIGVFSLLLTMLIHAAWFGVAWLFAQLPGSQRAGRDELRSLQASTGPLASGSAHSISEVRLEIPSDASQSAP